MTLINLVKFTIELVQQLESYNRSLIYAMLDLCECGHSEQPYRKKVNNVDPKHDETALVSTLTYMTLSVTHIRSTIRFYLYCMHQYAENITEYPKKFI